MRRKKSIPVTLEQDIRNLFQTQSAQAFSVTEIIDALFLSHKSFPEVKTAVYSLADSGFLRKDNKKYRLSNVTEPVTLPTKQAPKPVKTAQPQTPNLIEGTFDATSLARNYSYAFVRTAEGDFFVSSEDTLNAFHGDIIGIEPHYRNGKPDFCYVRKIIKRVNTSLAGDLQQSSGRYYFISGNPKITQWFDVSDIATAQPGMKVILEVTNWGNRLLSKPPIGKITEVLGVSGNPEVELLAVIRQNNLPLEFPEELEGEIAALPESVDPAEFNKRKDFRDLVTFTIDPSSAKDYDDAITLETTDSGWRLYVHIADVAHYIRTSSLLFGECVNRGNSYYFPRKVIPMLPEKLSNRLCSLRQDEEKLTMTVVTDFDTKGNVRHQALWESVIRSKARLAYEQVDDLFDGKPVEIIPEVIAALQSGRKLSKLLTQKRRRAGYLFFDLPETEYIYDEEGFVHHMEQSIETESHKLIENFMLVANQFVAEQLTTLAPVCMYRVHEMPDMEKLERLAILISAYGLKMNFGEGLNFTLQRLLDSMPDETYHRVFDRMVLRSLKKAKYTAEHLPHFGLAVDTYTHFTSPIRRLCDLVVHHLLKTYVVHSSEETFTRKQVMNYAAIASDKELIADAAEREIERVMNTIYMKKHEGEIYDGLITGMNSSTMFIQLNQLPVSGVLKIVQLPKGKWVYNDKAQRFLNDRSGIFFQLMDTLRVQVAQVSDDVYFDFVNEPDTHTHHVSLLTPQATFSKRRKQTSGRQHRKSSKKRTKR